MEGFVAFLILTSVGAYFLPALVAGSRKHPQALGIFLLDFLLGWTLVGWVIALVWAVQRPAAAAAPVGSYCTQCGNAIPSGARFCPRCGAQHQGGP